MKKGQVVLVISVIAGVILLISGTNGASSMYNRILQKLSLLFQDALIVSAANTITVIFIGLSSLGGILVMLGGYLVYKGHIGLGRLAIGLGGGVGIPWLLFILMWLLITSDLMTIVASHSILGWTGIILAFVARNIAR